MREKSREIERVVGVREEVRIEDEVMEEEREERDIGSIGVIINHIT